MLSARCLKLAGLAGWATLALVHGGGETFGRGTGGNRDVSA